MGQGVPALLKLLGEFDDKGELAHDLDLYRRPKGIIKLSGDAKKNPIRPDDIVWSTDEHHHNQTWRGQTFAAVGHEPITVSVTIDQVNLCFYFSTWH